MPNSGSDPPSTTREKQLLASLRDAGPNGHPSDDGLPVIFARARPSSFRILERYAYRKEISRNSWIEQAEHPSGAIEILVPYDGDTHFPRRAYEDVRRQHPRAAGTDQQTILIGHAVLSRFQRTDLDVLLDLTEHYGAFPLQVPLHPELLESPDDFLTGRCTSSTLQAYTPEPPDVHPLDWTIELCDDDGLTDAWFNGLFELADNDLAHALTRVVPFGQSLSLKLQITLHLPKHMEHPRLNKIHVSRLSIKWPEVARLKTVKLRHGPRSEKAKSQPDNAATLYFTYNMQSRSLELSDVKLEVDRTITDVVSYKSRPVIVEIQDPGELHPDPTLFGDVTIRVPGTLSGIQATLYEATGRRMDDFRPQLVTEISSSFRFILDDACSRRMLSLYQQFHFDELVPEATRVQDVVSVLQDLGFQPVPVAGRNPDIKEDETQIRGLARFRRSEGPDLMQMSVFIHGQKHRTERQTQEAGHAYKSVIPTGEIKVLVRGQLRGNEHALVTAMNQLHSALRERFRPLRSRK